MHRLIPQILEAIAAGETVTLAGASADLEFEGDAQALKNDLHELATDIRNGAV